MEKRQITVDERLDAMFVDDRDERIAAMSVEASHPRYGANHLRRPKRALTDREAHALNMIGVPADPTIPE